MERCTVCNLRLDAPAHPLALQIAEVLREQGEEAAQKLADQILPKALKRWEFIAICDAVQQHRKS